MNITLDPKNWIAPILTALLAAALAVAGMNLYIVPQLTEAQAESRGGGVTRFNTDVQMLSGAHVDNGLTVNTGGLTVSAGGITNSGAQTTTGNDVVGGTLTVTGTTAFVGATTFSASPIFSSESITPTTAVTLTITANIVTLTPAGAVGIPLAACTTGKWAIVYNSISANVVITDTGNFIGAGNQTLGQFDTLPLICIGATWVQIGPVSAN